MVDQDKNEKVELLRRLESGESAESVAAGANLSVDELRKWHAAIHLLRGRARGESDASPSVGVGDLVGLLVAQEIRRMREQPDSPAGQSRERKTGLLALFRWANAYWVVLAGLSGAVLWLWDRSVKLSSAEQQVDMLRNVAAVEKDLGSTLSQSNESMKSYGADLKARNEELKKELEAQKAALRNSSAELVEAQTKGTQASRNLQVAINTLKAVKSSSSPAATHVEQVIKSLEHPAASSAAVSSPERPRVVELKVTKDTGGLVFDGKFCVRSKFRGAFAYCAADTREKCEQQLSGLPSGTHECVDNPKAYFCYAWKPRDLGYPLATCFATSAECEAGRRGMMDYPEASEVGSACQSWPGS